MSWLFRDVTETISVAELVWTGIGIIGSFLCLWLTLTRVGTWRELRASDINGRVRLLATLRAVRSGLLTVVFSLFVVIGVFSMSVPTNPAIETADWHEAIVSVSIMAMEVVLFAKLVIEEVLETTINNMQEMQHAAKHGTTPRLGH